MAFDEQVEPFAIKPDFLPDCSPWSRTLYKKIIYIFFLKMSKVIFS